MPDDLQIPVASETGGRAPVSATYRPRASGRRTTRASPLRTAVIGGAAACALLLGGVGTWSLLHRTPAQVPVIEADSRPIRIKPENPGGMQVADAEDATTGPGDQRMAPAPEAPAPQALRAQMQPAAPVSAPAPVPVPVPAPLAASPLPDTPKPAARTAARSTPPPVTPPAQVATPTTPGTSVQIAAVDSEPAAQTEWQRLQKRLPDLLADRRPLLQKAERDGRTIWRVRVPGFTDVADATAFCTKVRARGANCAIASF